MSSEKPSFLSQPVVKNIYVYRNGDPYYEGRRLVINEKKVSSFETFLREVTGGVQAPFGAVRNIYTPKAGHRVSSMEHIQSGERYVAAGTEKFKKLDYSQIGTKKKKVLRSNAAMVKQVAQSRIVASARFLKPIKEPCLIFVVANGDVLNPPIRLLIPPRLLGLFERVLEMITEKMNLRIMGGVRSLYTLNGMLVSDGNDLESGQYYVAVGLEKLKKLPYSDLIFTKPASIRRFVGSKAASLPPIYRVKKQNEPVDSDQSKLMGGTNDTADSKMGSPNQGKEVPHCQARLMKLRQRKSVLTMSLGAQDNDEGDQREEEGAGDLEANQDDSVDTHLPDEKQIKGENESGTEESAGGNDDREEDGTASGAREVEEVKEEEIDGATAAVSEGEEGSTAGDTRPLVNGEMNEAEERGEERGEEDLAQILNGSEGEEDPTQILNGSEGEEDPAQILNGSEGEEDPTQILNGNEEKSEGEEDPAQILNGSEEKSEGEEDPAQILNGSEEKSEGEADNPTPAVNGNEVDGEEEGNRAKECGEETTNDPSPETEDKQAEEEREKEEDEAGDEEQENSEPEAKDDTNEGGGTSEETQEVTSPEEADPGGAPDGE